MSTSASVKYAAAHASPAGPGDARPTAQQIIEDEGLVGSLTDKVILITGASSGIGVETARALYSTGAHLYLPVRDVKKGEVVAADIKASHPSSQGSIDVLKLELDSLQSVRDCAAAFLSKTGQLNILICNAGVMATPEGRTKDGFETQFGTNHVAHFLLFQLLKPALLTSSTPLFNSRVVTLTSAGHQFGGVHLDDLDFKKSGYNEWLAYGQSKTANIYMATEIERRFGSQGLHATAVHPGGILTGLAKHVDPKIMEGYRSDPATVAKLKSPQQGAATTVWAAVSKEWEGQGGKYLENCMVAKPKPEHPTEKSLVPGYAPHAYDDEAAKKLWIESLALVGMQSE
jgi:NAD(P)-dependent dehydrogenase (short-subunit alcohol dehydrogenase family)